MDRRDLLIMTSTSMVDRSKLKKSSRKVNSKQQSSREMLLSKKAHKDDDFSYSLDYHDAPTGLLFVTCCLFCLNFHIASFCKKCVLIDNACICIGNDWEQPIQEDEMSLLFKDIGRVSSKYGDAMSAVVNQSSPTNAVGKTISHGSTSSNIQMIDNPLAKDNLKYNNKQSKKKSKSSIGSKKRRSTLGRLIDSFASMFST